MNRKLRNNLLAIAVLGMTTVFASCALSAPGASTGQLLASVFVAFAGSALTYPFVKRISLYVKGI